MSLVITLEHVDNMTGQWLQQESLRRGVGIEKVALALIRKGIQAEETLLRTYSDLNGLAGTWSEADVAEFVKNSADFETIDEALWR